MNHIQFKENSWLVYFQPHTNLLFEKSANTNASEKMTKLTRPVGYSNYPLLNVDWFKKCLCVGWC